MLTPLFLAIGSPITLKSEPYHNIFVTADPKEVCINPKDVHLLTGTIDTATGGTLKVHVANKTIADYTMLISPKSPKPIDEYNMSASYSCAGKTVEWGGHALILEDKLEQLIFTMGTHPTPATKEAIFLHGPNPPPPPPPPPSCATTGAANQTACDAVKPSTGSGPACSWCVSKDKLHSLCFVHKKKPPADKWDCDR